MEFEDFSPKRQLLCGVLILALVGCSSSTGYIDYADISGPQNPTESTTDDVTTDDVTSDDGTTDGTAIDTERSPSETDPAAPSSSAADMAVKSAGSEPVDGVAVQSVTPSEGSPPKVADAASSSPDGGTTGTTADAETPSPENTDPAITKNSDSAPAAPAAPASGPSTPAAVSTGPEAGADGETESSEPRQIKLLVPEKRFRTEKDSDAVRISYDDIDLLKVLNMEPVPVDAAEHFPQWLRDLNGKRIRLRGFMFPTFVATGITNFGLARDNGICCFVRQPKIYDMIEVSMAEGQSTDYIENKPFDVEGIFRIEPDGDDTELFQLYRIEEAIVLK